MLESQLSEAIVTARTIATLDNAARLMWRGHSEGLISDSGAEALSAAAEARRDALRGKCRPLLRQATRSRPRPCSCLLYTSPSPRDRTRSRMPSSA